MIEEGPDSQSTTAGRRSPALLLVLVMGIVGFTAAMLVVLADSTTAAPTPVAVRSQGIAGSLVNQPAPDFVLNDLDGEPVRLSDFRGQSVFLNFWATWCGPCRREMPAFQALRSRYHGSGLEPAAAITWDSILRIHQGDS